MLEVLIAIVVLSFGLLGLAGLQAAGLRASHQSSFRSIAAQQAYAMADRVRSADRGEGLANSYHLAAPVAKPSCDTTAGCSASDRASNDGAKWNTQLAGLLPSGSVLAIPGGVVCRDQVLGDGTSPAAHGCDGVGSIFVVKIWWEENQTGSVERFEMSFVP